jgi:hypothetical protein
MKHTTLIAGILLLLAGAAYSQGFDQREPARSQLGAPFYPGAVYVRTVQSNLDQYHTTAEYVTDDKLDTAVAFFERKLAEKREVIYEDKETYLVAFLLVTWSKVPGTPKKSDLDLLDKEPTVQVRAYDSDKYRPLIDYFFRKPDGKKKVQALENGRTLIRYTFRKSDEDVSGKKIVGVWRESDRDMPQFFGSVIEFRADDTYTFTFTAANMKARGKSGASYLEKGKYAILDNVISLESGNPLEGQGNRSGMATVGAASLSIELVNKPRMTFLRTK